MFNTLKISIFISLFLVAPSWADVDSFFDITYQINFSDGSYHTLNLRGEPLPALKLVNVGVGSVNTTDSFFDVFFDITLRAGAAAPDPASPSMKITMTGQYVPELATLALLLIGGFLGLARRLR